MIVSRTDGGRLIKLFLPFKHGRKWVREITLAPVTWDHTLKWQSGDYQKATDLLFDIAEQSATIIRMVRYPDVDRVMTQFFEMLPPEIRESIAAGNIPTKAVVQQPDEQPVLEEVPEVVGEPIEQLKPKEKYEPYRMPTKEEIAADMQAHPPPTDPFGHLDKNDEAALGFEVS